jgi:succinate-acetate transporter protein
LTLSPRISIHGDDLSIRIDRLSILLEWRAGAHSAWKGIHSMSADTASVAPTAPVAEPGTPPANQARIPADPLPLGLGSFGVSVLLLAITQAGLVDPAALPVSVLAVSLTAGGLGHIIAGLLHFVRGEGFPGTVFLSYAAFWFSYVLIVQFYAPSVVAKGGDPTAAIGWFLVAYAVVTTYLFITALATTKTLALLFALLLIGFYTVAIATFTGNSAIGFVAGWVLLADALVALYLSAALTMNDAWGRTILPAP